MAIKKEGLELKDILVKQRGWKYFLAGGPKKLLPVIFPSIILGYVFFNVANLFVDKNLMTSFQSRLFMAALAFLYMWFVLLLYMLSCLVYALADAYQRQGKEAVLQRLEFRKY